MKKTLITGFFIFLFSFAAALVAIMVLMTDHQAHLILARMEGLAPVSTEQKLVYYSLTAEGEDHFLAIGFYIFVTGFMTSLFLGKRFLKTVKDLHTSAVAINSGGPVPEIPAAGPGPGYGELKEIAKAMKQLSLDLRERERALALKNRYISMMLDALWVVDEENKNLVTDINPAFTELLGYGRDDIIGFPVFEFMDEKSEKILRRHLLAQEEGICSSCELMLISKQGDMVPVTVSWSPIAGDKEEAAGRLGIIRDRRLEAGLRETLRATVEYQQAFIDGLPEKLVVVDEGLNIVMSNKAAREESAGDLAGKPYDAVCSRETDCTSLNCPVRLVFKAGRVQRESMEMVKNQKKVFYEVTAYPVKNARGLTKHAAVIISDATEKRRFELELKGKERELAAIIEFSMIINRSLRGEDVFKPAIEKMVELTGMDGGCVFILDELGVELSSKYYPGLLAGFFKENGTFKMGEDIPGRVASGHPFTTADLPADPRTEKSILRQTGMRACAMFPMPGKEKITGVFLLFSFSKRELSVEDEKIIGHAVRLAGMSLDNVRLYEKMRQLYNHLKWRKDQEQKEENG